jgi:hypothetical protein
MILFTTYSHIDMISRYNFLLIKALIRNFITYCKRNMSNSQQTIELGKGLFTARILLHIFNTWSFSIPGELIMWRTG